MFGVLCQGLHVTGTGLHTLALLVEVEGPRVERVGVEAAGGGRSWRPALRNLERRTVAQQRVPVGVGELYGDRLISADGDDVVFGNTHVQVRDRRVHDAVGSADRQRSVVDRRGRHDPK